MGQGPQKPEHGGNFVMTPRRVLKSVAWRHASLRARVILTIFQSAHNGWNNDRLRMSLSEICQAVGDQNRGANARAIVELIELGFLECTSEADHPAAKAREYRITFISTGEGKHSRTATHEYDSWRPGPCKKRKFGGAKTAPPIASSGAETAPVVKVTGAVTTPRSTVSGGFEAPAGGAVTAPLLDNQSVGRSSPSQKSEVVQLNPSRARIAINARVDLDELRDWMRATIEVIGYGGARRLAQDARITEPVISRFRAGRSLPDLHRRPLQEACGRVLSYKKWREDALRIAWSPHRQGHSN